MGYTASSETEKLTTNFLIMDEAAQTLEPEAVCILTRMPDNVTIILVGDHRQLRPCTQSKLAREGGLECSLFERWFQQHTIPRTMLNCQYRMHPSISAFPNTEFYGGKVQDGVTPADRPAIRGLHELGELRCVFIDIDGWEDFVDGTFQNVAEAEFVLQLLHRIHEDNKMSQLEVAVITPYNAQSHAIKKKIQADMSVKIATVDSFQGAQADIVLCSL
eukprot:5100057-Karenia_brevis.AAC.1